MPGGIIYHSVLHPIDTYEEFKKNFLAICEAYRAKDGTMCYSFVLYRDRDAHLPEVFGNRNYWAALDEISGKNLTVFGFRNNPRIIHRPSEATNALLKEYFEMDKEIRYPAILFFQMQKKKITDHFFVNLKETEKEKSFLEIKKIMETAEASLNKIAPDYKKNYAETIPVLKRALEHEMYLVEVAKAGKKVKSVTGFLKIFYTVFGGG